MPKLYITRQQLASFLKDPLTLREFERFILELEAAGSAAAGAAETAEAAQDAAQGAQLSVDLLSVVVAQAEADIDALQAIEFYPPELGYAGW